MRWTSRSAAGLVVGALGATIWAALSYYSGWELAYLAWAIGLGVGVVVHLGNGRRAEIPSGVVAVGITLLAVLAGKAVSVVLIEERRSEEAVLAAEGDLLSLDEPELIISYLADELTFEYLARGEELEWPEGVDPTFARAESDYPRVIWTEAAERWEGMDVEHRRAFVDRIRLESEGATPPEEPPGWWAGLLAGLGPMDAVFILLALATAFHFGMGRPG